MLSIFGVSLVLYFVKILSGSVKKVFMHYRCICYIVSRVCSSIVGSNEYHRQIFRFCFGRGGGLPKIYGGAKNLGGKVERQGA
jgi:hypothetical protein